MPRVLPNICGYLKFPENRCYRFSAQLRVAVPSQRWRALEQRKRSFVKSCQEQYLAMWFLSTPASNWLGFFVLLPGQASTGYKKLLVKDVLSLLRDPGFVPFLMPAELNGFLGNNVQGMKSS